MSTATAGQARSPSRSLTRPPQLVPLFFVMAWGYGNKRKQAQGCVQCFGGNRSSALHPWL